MWMIHPGQLASQNTLFQRQSVKEYVAKCRLKLWYCKLWTEEQRHSVIKTIEDELGKPWYKRFYDFPAIIGQLFWHEFQTPGLSICSDYGSLLRMVDGEKYDLRYPDPEQVNRWLGQQPGRYEVYGRYVPD